MKQAGSGIGGFSGNRYQKGDGFFGRFVSGSILPLIKKVLPYLGRQALATGSDVLNDVAEGQKLGESIKKRLRETGDKINTTAMAKVREMTGSGRKRRKRRTRKPSKPGKQRKRAPNKKKRNTRSKKAKDFL